MTEEQKNGRAIEMLKERVRYLEETNQWMLESFEEVSAIDDERSFANSKWDQRIPFMQRPESIWAASSVSIPLRSTGRTELNNEFRLRTSTPPGNGTRSDGGEQLIEEGLFGWALHQNRPITIPSRTDSRIFVLHGIETQRKVIGMFVGIAQSAESIPNKMALSLMSIGPFKTAVGLEQLELYRRISNHNRILEEKVEERTKELIAAKDVALRASRLKSEFVANMSHELRTPLSGIIGISELLMESELGAEERRYAKLIRASGDALLAIINDILDFSKIEAGKLLIENIPFDLVHVLDEVVAILKGKADAKRLALSCEYTLGDNSKYSGDPLRIRQIVMNLVGNAIKFTDHGSITVRATLETNSSERSTVKIIVADTGIGIAEDILVNLFQSFTQGDGSTTRRYGGTGLGLAICKQLVELMGGTIGVRSHLGEGSTFWFTIPLPRQSQNPAAAEPVQEQRHNPAKEIPADDPLLSVPGRAEEASFNNDLRVLVAEDNLVNQEVSAGMLSKLGYRVTVVPDGLQAVQENLRLPFDIIFMDCQMPVMDGYEATRRIREHETSGGRAIIIAMTANAFEGDRERCIRSGMDDYIAKPFRRSEFREMLTKWTLHLRDARRKSAGNARAQQPAPPESGSVIDRSRIREINSIKSGLRPNLLLRIIRHFRDDVPQKIAAMREGCDNGDALKVRSAAHALHGSSAQLGAVVLAGVSEEIEKLAIKGLLREAGSQLGRVEASFAQAVSELSTFIPKDELK